MELRQIASIETGFPEKFGIPRQSGLVPGLRGRIVFLPAFRSPDAVRGLEGYSHIWLLWGFSQAVRAGWCPTVAPPRLGGKKKMGVFATRSPFRPNPIGLSCLKLEAVALDERLGPVLTVSGVDMLDGTPVYDIKPYLPAADCHPEALGGFAAEVAGHSLALDFPQALLAHIAPDDRETVAALLRQDPRTAFIHDETRVWGVAYKQYNVRFTVQGDRAHVCEVSVAGEVFRA